MKKRIITISIILVIIISSFMIYKKVFNNSKKLYSENATHIIKENNINNVYNKDYSKTLDKVLQDGSFKEEYLDEYIIIEYIEEENFISNINKFLTIGYDGNEINDIYKLSKINREKLLNLEKQEFKKYIDIPNFNIDNLERYNNYKNKTNKDIQTIVTYININLDKEFYEDSKLVTNPNDLTVIVNKYNHIDKDFVPNNLVTLFDSKNNAKMVKEAADAYKKFIEAANRDGLTLESTTAYRSYSFQNTLYTNYVKEDGKELADTYSARPGSSEHQLGLAVDLNNPNVEGKRLSDNDYKWVLENSYKYGFIVRYTKDGIPITGYMEEPWHIRYLGIELATKVYESGLTYEEYYDLYIMKY